MKRNTVTLYDLAVIIAFASGYLISRFYSRRKIVQMEIAHNKELTKAEAVRNQTVIHYGSCIQLHENHFN